MRRPPLSELVKRPRESFPVALCGRYEEEAARAAVCDNRADWLLVDPARELRQASLGLGACAAARPIGVVVDDETLPTTRVVGKFVDMGKLVGLRA